MSKQIAAVTKHLTTAMSQTHTVLKDANAARSLNDHEHYAQIVDQLEALTVATLSATSSQPLTGKRAAGARFDIGARTDLARAVSESVAYLQGTATGLLVSDLPRYTADNVVMAKGLLAGLYGLLRAGIITQARTDLQAVADMGPKDLVLAADVLAGSAAGPRDTPAEDNRTGA